MISTTGAIGPDDEALGASVRDALSLFSRWVHMWNADPGAAHEIIASEFTTHLPLTGMPPSGAVHDPHTMQAWVEAFRSSFSSGSFSPVLGPVVSGDLLIWHWQFTGIWRGGRPVTAAAPAGTTVRFRGADFLRIAGDRITEYWLTDDQLDLYAQLGAGLGS